MCLFIYTNNRGQNGLSQILHSVLYYIQTGIIYPRRFPNTPKQKALLTDSVLLFCNSVPKHKHFKRTNAYQTRTNDHFPSKITPVINVSYQASYQKRTSAYQKAKKSSFGTISFPHFHRPNNFFAQNPVENYQKIVPWYS